MAQIKPWTVSDALWRKIEPLVPKPKRERGRKYQRKPGAGRKPMPTRQVFAAIVYVLRTGCQWKALPKEYGSASAVHAYFQRWRREGSFLKIWKAGLAEYDELEGIAWRWQSVDGASGKAPLAQECVGPNSTDRGKNGRKHSLLVDARGIPLSLVASGAKQAWQLSVARHSGRHRLSPAGSQMRTDRNALRRCGLRWLPGPGGEPSAPLSTQREDAPSGTRRETKGSRSQGPRMGRRTHPLLAQPFSKLLISFEKTEASYTALLSLAAALISWRQTVAIYGYVLILKASA